MKIEEQVLSREQMKHLQELGVDTSDASMCWLDFEDNEPMEVAVFIPQIMLGYATCKIYPTYTIGDLIEKLPKKIKEGVLLIDYFDMEVSYMDWSLFKQIDVYSYKSGTLINALYRLFCCVAKYHKELLEVKK